MKGKENKEIVRSSKSCSYRWWFV